MTPEQSLCRIIADLLELPAVEPDDDFFTMGGHSLLAAQLVKRIRSEHGIRIPLRLVYQTPTPAALAGHLTSH